jgi:hypothetical protein
MLTVYGLSAYLAFVIVAISVAWNISEKTVEAKSEQILLGEFGLVEIILMSICVVLGPLNEALVMTLQSIEKLTTLKAENKA